ncbi:MAG: DUF4493 domain-containing protein [Alistipes sp.]|nr:DUF4493 domain-containing protein [Alistipes sp.]
MKKLIQSFFALVAASLMLAGCVNERADFGTVSGGTTGQETGYLTFAEGGLTVITDAEVVRSTTLNVDDFDCKIIKVDTQEEIAHFTYGSRPTEPTELEVGVYELQVSSGEVPQVAWESPVYGVKQPFTIKAKELTTLSDVKCKLQNIKVTVAYDADLFALLEAGSKSDVTVGANKMEFLYTEERASYFYAAEELNDMTVDMALTYAGKSTTMSTTIDGVKAGQWRKITINMPHANEGNVSFTITVETLTLDEEITVDVAEVALLTEPVIPDLPGQNPLAPILTWEGHDLNETFQLLASHFDENGTCTTPVVISADANNSTFTDFEIAIASTNSGLISALASMNIKEQFDLCEVTASSDAGLNNILKMLGIPTGSNVLGKASITLPFSNLMSTLYDYNGTHTFTMTVKNEAGHLGQYVLTILVDKANEPGADGSPRLTLYCSDGLDFDATHVVTADLQVQVEVTAPGRISEFFVDVEGFMVDEATGTLMGMSTLPKHLDLVNPLDGYRDFLGNFFPIEDEVLGQTYIAKEQFDISRFMGMILALGETGEVNFQLTVIDEAGLEAVKTLKLLVE